MKIKYCLIILFLLSFTPQTAHSADASQSIFNERLNSFQKLHKEEGHCDLSKLDIGKLKQFVELNRDKKVVFFKIDEEYELVLRKYDEQLAPDGIIRIKAPLKDDKTSEAVYAAKTVEYETGKWIKEHPDKPYYYHPHCPPQKQQDGTWWCETGPAVIAGHGLNIILNADFSLKELSEKFNPE